MSEETEQSRGFTVKDRRLSKRDEEESAEEEPRPERAEVAPDPGAPAEPETAAGEEPPGGLPQPDFAGFILSLANTALINLGVVPDPSGGSPEANIEGAKQMVDILGILREKTQGNLTEEEDRLLEQILAELRMRFVEVVRSAGSGGPAAPVSGA